MTPIPHARPASVQPLSSPARGLSEVPPWWYGHPERFDAIVDIRRKIHRHDKATATKARSVMMATIVGAVSIYSVDATGAMSIPVGSNSLLILGALMVVAVVAWLLDRRLVQQLGDLDLRSHLWIDLVEAIRDGSIDVTMLHPARTETEIEGFLRREAAVAAKFLASQARLTPRLPTVGHCFTLENS